MLLPGGTGVDGKDRPRYGAGSSQQIADPVAARQLGLQALENLRRQQASSLAYFDCFWMFAGLTFVLVFVALCLK